MFLNQKTNNTFCTRISFKAKLKFQIQTKISKPIKSFKTKLMFQNRIKVSKPYSNLKSRSKIQVKIKISKSQKKFQNKIIACCNQK